LVVEPLIPLQTVPLCAPEQLAAASAFLTSPTAGSRLLLHYRDHMSWCEWFESAGLNPDLARAGQIFDDANVVVEAAVAGQGIALGYMPVSKVELKDGRLAIPHPHRCDAAFGYHLVYRHSAALRPPVALFRDWLLQQAALSRAGLST
jgi:LysR family glycine cleavage system transcriptional activator